MNALKTVLIGFGKIGASYSADPLTAKYYRYATHAQVLSRHPAFDWQGVVDPDEQARARAEKDWNVPHVTATVSAMLKHFTPDVAVIATPADIRLSLLEQMASVRAVLVEKPLGLTKTERNAFVAACRKRNIPAQVNFWRRADQMFQELAAGRLRELIGDPQCAFGVYGNGLINNGSHMIDFIRMLFGEIDSARATNADADNPSFELMIGRVPITFHALDFSHYREIGLEIWGTNGKLSILNEGLSLHHAPRRENRALTGEKEITHDRVAILASTVGDALYRMYDNLAAAVHGEAHLWSDAASAARTADVVDAISGPGLK